MQLVVSNESCIAEEVAAVALPTATLSVIIPAYNEVRTVVEILQRVLRQSVVAEIVLVDDGSTDGTLEAVQQFSESARPSDRNRLVLLQHPSNRGKGRAIRTALEHVSGSHVLIQDADLEYDPHDIGRLWSTMQSGVADVVYGSRYLNAPQLQRGRFVLQSGVRLLNLLCRIFFRVTLTDEATCYKMFRTEQLRQMELECERFEFCAEVTAKAAVLGYKTTEVPVSFAPRLASEGKKLKVSDGFWAVCVLLRTYFGARKFGRASYPSQQIAGRETGNQLHPVWPLRLVALLLVTTAALKFGQTEKSSFIFPNWWVGSFELFFAFFLVCRAHDLSAWISSVGIFSLFLGFNAASVYHGDKVCGCLGFLAVSPSAMLVVDFAVIAGLLMTIPFSFSSIGMRGLMTAALVTMILAGAVARNAKDDFATGFVAIESI